MKMTLKNEENSEIIQNYLLRNANFMNYGERDNINNLKDESEILDSFEKNNLNSRDLLNKTNLNSAFSSKILGIFNDIPYLKKLQNYTNQSSMKNNKSIISNNNNPISNNLQNTNYNFFQGDKKSDHLLHINSCLYGKVLIFSDKQ